MSRSRRVCSLALVAALGATLLSSQIAIALGWSGVPRSAVGARARGLAGPSTVPAASSLPATASRGKSLGRQAEAIESGVQIYFANAQGQLVNVTASYSYQEGHIYSLATGDLVATVPDYQDGATAVYDLYGNWIGEVSYPVD
jgi:hypothetical protein